MLVAAKFYLRHTTAASRLLIFCETVCAGRFTVAAEPVMKNKSSGRMREKFISFPRTVPDFRGLI